MPSYSTPGVYIEEIPVFPPSVAPVATAVPAFIGYTEKAVGKQGESLTEVPVRLTSLLEYETCYGKAPLHDLSINLTKKVNAAGELLEVKASWDPRPALPAQFLHYSMQLYFANGGGPCYVYSVGAYGAAADKADFSDAIAALEAVDEPTLLVFPDAVKLTDGDYGSVVDAALTSCNKTQDRFTIADVRNAVPGGNDDNAKVTANFRGKISKNAVDFLKYGAAYFPYLSTNVPFRTSDANVTLKAYNVVTVAADGSETTAAVPNAAGKKLNDAALDIKGKETLVYSAVQRFLGEAYVTLPPSGAIAGVYAQVDRTRGVWKAPANAGLSLVVGPAIMVTNDLQDGLNIDAGTGKSVNAIRSFFGKGTIVWGARTLAGNDNEWRYVNVRRFANFVEESVKKATNAFVFESNDANTWIKVQTMIENFLIIQWRDGALMGGKPEDAFKVAVGLGKTMTAQDVLNGYMIVEIHLAIVRPAEFIVLRFMQKMPQS
ncbi:MAG: phage tail sheath family protein [Rhizobiales bacterium]|nr:phage tail sheath family protein [Hyphomicrobiales bacterium]